MLLRGGNWLKKAGHWEPELEGYILISNGLLSSLPPSCYEVSFSSTMNVHHAISAFKSVNQRLNLLKL